MPLIVGFWLVPVLFQVSFWYKGQPREVPGARFQVRTHILAYIYIYIYTYIYRERERDYYYCHMKIHYCIGRAPQIRATQEFKRSTPAESASALVHGDESIHWVLLHRSLDVNSCMFSGNPEDSCWPVAPESHDDPKFTSPRGTYFIGWSINHFNNLHVSISLEI